MLMDITLPVSQEMLGTAWGNTNPSLVGHLGTHFDGMDKEFPLEYNRREGIVFDVSSVSGREIDVADVDLSLVGKDMFVAFYTGFIHRMEYGTAPYFKEHPQLSQQLIQALLDKKISIIGLDFAGIRRAPEHVPADQRCAEHGVFVVENLWDLEKLLAVSSRFVAHTYPLRLLGVTGLPCRVVAEV